MKTLITLRFTEYLAPFAILVAALSVLPSVLALPFPNRLPGNKLTSSDAQAGDEFGYFLAISGDLAIISSVNEDGGDGDPIDAAGAAYVFDTETGQEIYKLSASDPGEGDIFGWQVDISEHLAIVGAHREDGGVGDPKNNAGAAYVFDLATGTELYKLTASDAEADDWFGVSVAISGNYAIVGAHGEDGGIGDPMDSVGAVYVFDLRTGNEIAKLLHSDPQPGDQFGRFLEISGNYILSAAHFEDGGAGDLLPNSGAVYVFDLTTGEQLHKLTAPDAQPNDNFGNRSAISGDIAIIAARYEDGGAGDPTENAGAAYLFDLRTGEQLHKLTASDAEAADQFGVSVAISENIALVGSFGEDGSGGSGYDSGAAYAFDVSTGEELARFTATDSGHGDRLGVSVAISGDLALAGAYFEDGGEGDPGNKTGATYAFRVPLFQPDSKIGTSPFTGVGEDIHNANGSGQSLTLISKRLRPTISWATIGNDGNMATDLQINGSPGNSLFGLSYFRHFSGRRSNVTAAVVAGNHEEDNVIPDEPGRLLSAEVRPSTRLRKTKRRKRGRKKKIILRRQFTTMIKASSIVRPSKNDSVLLRVSTR